jgi:hypothetical protein
MNEPTAYRGPDRHAHGKGYWALIGWWWEPLAWLGRMLLWLTFFPAGIWRSLRKSRKNREARERRGIRS